MSIFTAGVQYNDFKGTVAADRSDNTALVDYVSRLGLTQTGERVVGCRIVFNENPSNEINSGVVVYLQAGSFDDPSATIRAVEVEMPIQKLFAYFKRFDMVMTVNGETFDDTEVDGPHYL
jgi:hypothetical protein